MCRCDILLFCSTNCDCQVQQCRQPHHHHLNAVVGSSLLVASGVRVVTVRCCTLWQGCCWLPSAGVVLDWLQCMCYFPFVNTWGLVTPTAEKNTLIYMMITLVFSDVIWKHALLSLPPLSRPRGPKIGDNCNTNCMMLSLAARKPLHWYFLLH